MIRILTGILLLSLSSCSSIKETYKYYNMHPVILTGDPDSTSYAGSNFYKRGEERYQPDIFVGIEFVGEY